MSGVTIAWDEAVPPITEAAGLGYARIQSDKTSTRMGLDAEHGWPTAGGLSGYHRYGSARAFVGTQSRVSSSDTDGRLMVASDTSQLFGVGSTGTNFIGGPRVISADSYPSGAAPSRYQFVDSFGTATTGSDGAVMVTFPNSGYSNLPIIVATPNSIGTTAAFVNIGESRTTNFTAHGFVDASGVSISLMTLGSIQFAWRAVGLRVL